MKKIDLEYFRQPLDWLDPDFGAMLVKSAVACLQKCGHLPGIEMGLELEGSGYPLELDWTSILNENQRGTLPNDQELTQKGAECVALYIALLIKEFESFETARIGTRVDFFLKRSRLAFDFDAKLEVSGILIETTTNNSKARFKEKKDRALAFSDDSCEIFVSIVEFSKPKASFNKI